MLEQMIAKRKEIMEGDSNIKLQLVNILDRMIANYESNNKV
ncbi:MAG TPA: hypothetical protein PKV66_03125 [Candidatus Pelethenecus sp.]|nr:hypothetical protein [Candidatus Pelethenecus sp.]